RGADRGPPRAQQPAPRLPGAGPRRRRTRPGQHHLRLLGARPRRRRPAPHPDPARAARRDGGVPGPGAPVIALLLLLGAAPPGPSFDCARAASPAEEAICADPALAALDRGLAQAWAGARGRLKGDAPALAALKHDQELFLYARDLVM
ncbi:MAG: hypothetical protein ACK559_19345, partial [bacterium]